MNWPRVNRHRRCEICHKDSWCTYNERGSGCMRVESQVPMRNGGWWHPNDSQVRERYVPPAKSVPGNTLIDCETLLRKWRGSQKCQLEPFAATLGVSPEALRALGCVWAGDHRAFAFPMVDAQRRVIGIRLRNELGDKWAVKGSRSGLFMNLPAAHVPAEPEKIEQIGLPAGEAKGESLKREGATYYRDGMKEPRDSRGGRQLLIVEGPTDTAAAIDLGFSVVGRPACLGCEDLIVSVAKQSPRVRLFIIADADSRQCPMCKGEGCGMCNHTGILEPGQRGARKLQEKLHKAKIVTLPAKDLRAAVQQGLTRERLQCILDSQI